jgi:DNA-binding transcriptional ArsR family regulator
MSKPTAVNAVFEALADTTRRRIVEMLSDGQTMTVSGITRHFDVSRQAVAKHLGILRDARLLRCDRRGRERLNSLQPGALDPVAEWTRRYTSFWDDRLTALKKRVERRRTR